MNILQRTIGIFGYIVSSSLIYSLAWADRCRPGRAKEVCSPRVHTWLVAQPGFEPGTPGYEPDEITRFSTALCPAMLPSLDLRHVANMAGGFHNEHK